MSKLHLHLRKRLEQAILKHGMLAEGDRVLVGVSGGADSLTLLKLMTGPMLFVPKPEFVIAVHLDLGFEGKDISNYSSLEQYFREGGYNYHMERTNIGPLAHSPFNRKASPCFLCSKMRRKRLFELAKKYRCNKLALAHHKDDLIETFLLNVFYSREISTMLPYQSFFKGDFYLLRPLAYVEESLLKRFAKESQFPVLKNHCPTAENSKRKYIKDLLKKLEEDHRGLKENIFKAMKHVKPDYLLQP
jgi:tRNA 2-thiocytidine biosynthesis protein TtcA